MYKFVNLVFLFFISTQFFYSLQILNIFLYWFCGLASLRLIFRKSPLPTNIYKEILPLDKDFCLKIISSMCYHYSTYMCVCVCVCVYACFSFDFSIECSKRLFVTVYGVDLEHLFQLKHLGMMGKFSYVYQMTKFVHNCKMLQEPQVNFEEEVFLKKRKHSTSTTKCNS